MHQARSVTAQDYEGDCPVPLDLVARLMRTEADAAPGLLDGIPEATRARLAVWLYWRRHTLELGVSVATTCGRPALHREAGLIGNLLYDLSRLPGGRLNIGTCASGPLRVSSGDARIAA